MLSTPSLSNTHFSAAFFCSTLRKFRSLVKRISSSKEKLKMGWIEETMASVKSFKLREALHQAVCVEEFETARLGCRDMYDCCICFDDMEVANVCNWKRSPVVVVLSESMEPGFARGDILFLHMSQGPIRAGEIVVYNVDKREIPIVHRVIKVHERRETGEVYILTKGDNNNEDDIGLYAPGQRWLQRTHIMGRAVGFLPYAGWVTIIMSEKPLIKYILIGALGLLVITSKD